MTIYDDLLKEMVPETDPLYETLQRFNQKILPSEMPEYPKALEAAPQTPAEEVITPTQILAPGMEKFVPDEAYLYWVEFTYTPLEKPNIWQRFRNYLYEHWGIR
jgi:hypothetical protein